MKLFQIIAQTIGQRFQLTEEESLVRPATMHKDLIEAIAGRNGERHSLFLFVCQKV